MRTLSQILAVIVAVVGCAQAARQYQEAKFVEYSTYSPCHYDCQPFNVVYFNFCFQVDKQFLIGNTYAWKWEYDPAEMKSLEGSSVSVRFKDNRLWVIRTDGKELLLRRLKVSTHFKNPNCNSPIP
jgi:hypothetical protein